MEGEDKILKAVLIYLFGKYPYLLQYISLPEISKRTSSDPEIVKKILKTVWEEAQREEEKEMERRRGRLLGREEEEYSLY